jgi:hypothetical protein
MMQKYKEFSPTAFDSKANYLGDSLEDQQDWLIVLGQNRDSDLVSECNFTLALELLGNENENVQVHRFGHWACGWYEVILVRPDTNEHTIAENIRKNLDDYPILDDDVYSDLLCERVSDYIESMSDWEKQAYIDDVPEIENENDIWDYLFENWD